MQQLAQLDANLQRAAPRRGLGRLGAVRRRAGARPRRRHRRAPGPRRPRRRSPSSSPSPTTAPGWTTSTSTSLARQLGDEAAVDARTLQQLEQALRDTGYLKRGSDGQLRLSPKAMRQLGKALLRDVADADVRPPGPARRCARPARPASCPGATREWEFGDTEPWDVTRTITNAVRAHRRPRAATPRDGVRLDIDDVEVSETEARTQAARRAAGRHVVLDGDGRPLGADEAHRARAAHADPVAVPRRRTSS